MRYHVKFVSRGILHVESIAGAPPPPPPPPLLLLLLFSRQCHAIDWQLLRAVGLEPNDLELKTGDRVRLIATLDTPLGRIELG
eukprot:COSAG02_NODE_8288_length_2631_cov_2.456951_3_plen_83_part_00